MNKILHILVILASVTAISSPAFADDAATSTSHKGKKSVGFMGLGYYEISNFESLYVPFATSGIRAAGAGFESFFEYGVADSFGVNFAAGYNRLLYANKFRTQVAENFFLLDVTGHYYFDAGKAQPFLAGGIGAEISTQGVAPTLDLGGGADFMVNDNVSVRLQVLYKTAIIHHRAEAGLGIAYHF
jgi:opacity protein-like surface antigen